MTTKSLHDRFAESGGAPIKYEGWLIHGAYRRDMRPGHVLRVRFLGARQDIRQGLSLSMKTGVLVVKGKALKDIVLWADTAPDMVEIVCRPPRSGATLAVWNSWETPPGVHQAWLGNSGLQVEEEQARVVLRCSDGLGEPDFNDLVVELQFLPAGSRGTEPDTS